MKGIRLMKTVSILAGLLFLFAVIPACGQDGSSSPPAASGRRGQGHMMASPEERADRLSKALSLSDDQKAKMLSIYQDEQKQMSALHSDSEMSRQDRRSKMQQIHQGTVDQIKAVLNSDQAQKFDEMQQNMDHHRGTKSNDGGSPQP